MLWRPAGTLFEIQEQGEADAPVTTLLGNSTFPVFPMSCKGLEAAAWPGRNAARNA